MRNDKGWGVIVLFLLVLSVSAGYVWHEYDKKQQAQLKRQAFFEQIKEMQNLVQKWDDANQLASSTPRIALAGPVGSLQTVKRETQALIVTDCLTTPHSTLVNTMSFTIEAYIDFMSDKEYLAEAKLKQVLDMQKRFKDELDECSKSQI